MKYVLTALFLSLVLNLSQAKTSTLGQAQEYQKPSASLNQTQTKNAVAPAIPRIKKPKLLRSNPHRLAAIRLAGIDPAYVIDDEDLIVGRRYEIKLEAVPDEDVSDYVKTRLFIARARALQKYQEKWG